MSVLILVAFILIFLTTGGIFLHKAFLKECLLITVVIFSTAIVCITETLSLFHLFNYKCLILTWGSICVLGITFIYIKYSNVIAFCMRLKQKIAFTIRFLKAYQKIVFLAAFCIGLIAFIQGIVYPPNNFDSMTYHLARITSWISNGSVAHYPTNIPRQLYQPPFAEYLIAQINILTGSDRYSFIVQFCFLIFSVIGLLYILSITGVKSKYNPLAVLLIFTIPEVMLEASSTQNDIVVAFFLICTCIFAFKAFTETRLKNFIFLGLSLGLGIFTKGTAYLYMAPVVLIFGLSILFKLFKTKDGKLLAFSLISITCIMLINCPFYLRNYRLNHSILGVDKNESKMYANQQMSPALLFSNITKNAALQIGIFQVDILSIESENIVRKMNKAIHIDVDNPNVNYQNMKFTTAGPKSHEDHAPNFFHFILINLSLIVIMVNVFKKRKPNYAFYFALILIIQVTLFCFYLKWQPWHTRLHVPLFLLGVPVIVYSVSISTYFRKSIYLLLPVIFAVAILTVCYNMIRPFNKRLFDPRYKNYFLIKDNRTYQEYNVIKNQLEREDLKNIGLILDLDAWEYPLFTNCYRKQLNPVHLFVTNVSNELNKNPVKLDCIISITVKRKFIDYNGRRFVNQKAGNQVLYFYK